MNKIRIYYDKADHFKENDPEKVVEEDTKRSAEKIFNNLRLMGYEAYVEAIKKEDILEKMRNFSPDEVFFNDCEWTGNGYEIEVEMLKIAYERDLIYTGCNYNDYLWGGDKLAMKKLFSEHKADILAWALYDGDGSSIPLDFEFPAIVKTTKEHCSVGLDDNSVVYDRKSAILKCDELFNKYHQPILLEKFAFGSEYQVFVFETSGSPLTLPVYETEYVSQDKPILATFDDNWSGEGLIKKTRYIGKIRDANKDLAIRKYSAQLFVDLKIKGYVRIDYREDEGRLKLLEINPNPSIGWTDKLDFLVICATAAGYNYQDILALILASARKGL